MVQQAPAQPVLMMDGMKKILHILTDMRLADDADDAMLDAIQQPIVEHLRGPVDDMMAMGQDPGAQQGGQGGGIPPEIAQMMGLGGGGQGGGDMGGMSMAAGMNPALATGGQGVPGLRQNSALPPVDELRRMVQGNYQ